jgi:hypothetical protein
MKNGTLLLMIFAAGTFAITSCGGGEAANTDISEESPEVSTQEEEGEDGLGAAVGGLFGKIIEEVNDGLQEVADSVQVAVDSINSAIETNAEDFEKAIETEAKED